MSRDCSFAHLASAHLACLLLISPEISTLLMLLDRVIDELAVYCFFVWERRRI